MCFLKVICLSVHSVDLHIMYTHAQNHFFHNICMYLPCYIEILKYSKYQCTFAISISITEQYITTV